MKLISVKFQTMNTLYIIFGTIYFMYAPSSSNGKTIVDVSDMFVYYEPISQLPLRITSIQNSLSNLSLELEQSSSMPEAGNTTIRRVGYRSNGCTCQELTCGCCAGFKFKEHPFNSEGCMNFTYDPFEFAIRMNMLMNEKSIFTTSVSAKNPPPVCVPVPLPYLPMVDFCAKLFDIHTPGHNLHMCLDFETRVQRATLLVLHFNCMKMGVNGLSLVKPGETGETGPDITTETQVDADKFDEINEIKYIITN